MLAAQVGLMFKGIEHVSVPFAGGMSEIQYMDARTLIVNDLHKDIINLARVIKDDKMRPHLYAELQAEPFHVDVLIEAQEYCLTRPLSNVLPDYNRAKAYFISQWMNRSCGSGTDREFTGKLSTRWGGDSLGGDSNTRYRSAVASLEAWAKIFVRCTFLNLDVFDFLGNVKDSKHCGIYLDPPFPDVGEAYKHSFTTEDHHALANWLIKYRSTRIVCRFYDHPLVRELYSTNDWEYNFVTGRKQSNASVQELLLRRH
jgi:DNA adenine methylase